MASRPETKTKTQIKLRHLQHQRILFSVESTLSSSQVKSLFHLFYPWWIEYNDPINPLVLVFQSFSLSKIHYIFLIFVYDVEMDRYYKIERSECIVYVAKDRVPPFLVVWNLMWFVGWSCFFSGWMFIICF